MHPTRGLHQRAMLSIFSAIFGLLFTGGIFTASPASAAPPSFSGCSVIDNGRPRIQQDQTGSYIQAILKYRCNSAKEFDFVGVLYQDVDSQGGDYVVSIANAGVNTSPYVTGGFGICDGTRSTQFNIVYYLTLGGVDKYYQTPAYTFNCHYNV